MKILLRQVIGTRFEGAARPNNLVADFVLGKNVFSQQYSIDVGYRAARSSLEKLLAKDTAAQSSAQSGGVSIDPNSFAESLRVSLPKAASKIENAANFNRWFGDSKVVTGEGKPMVVFHGTAGDLKDNSFDPKRIGDIFQDDKFGFFFTNNTRHDPFEDAQSAGAYARNAAYETGKAPSIIPAYVSLQNPFVIDSADVGGFDGRLSVEYLEAIHGKEKLLNDITSGSHDGAMVIDRDANGNNGQPETIVIALRPEQIKSVYNTGRWSRSNPDVMFSLSAPSGTTGRVEETLGRTQGPVTDRDIADNLADKGQETKGQYASRQFSSMKREFGDASRKILGKISSEIEKYSPKIAARLRKMEIDIFSKTKHFTDRVETLMSSAKSKM
ncbi:MAG: hypothetical protein D3910_21415, partial [Candidatus Electrothrix sp. ATG2]|nr:hypothetical protein [Candidatus Electrothrix sp. ATG2]